MTGFILGRTIPDCTESGINAMVLTGNHACFSSVVMFQSVTVMKQEADETPNEQLPLSFLASEEGATENDDGQSNKGIIFLFICFGMGQGYFWKAVVFSSANSRFRFFSVSPLHPLFPDCECTDASSPFFLFSASDC